MFGIKEIDSQTLAAWQKEGKTIRILDVRSPVECTQGMIENGEPIPLHLIPLKADELENDVDTVIYCRSGARSAQACAFLMARGHNRVFNLRGGIIDWVRCGNSLVNPSGQVA